MTPLPERWRMGKKTAIGLDIVIVIVVALWLLLIEIGLFPHAKRGFFCGDTSIQFPFNGDTVTAWMLAISVFVPIFCIWAAEAIFYHPSVMKVSRSGGILRNSLRWWREYVVGIVFHLFVVDALKVLVGELRPHFIDTCKPSGFANCTQGQYIADYVCTNTVDSDFFVRDASKSFPSGHSSISFFEAVFMVWYLQCRLPRFRSQFLLIFIQMMCLLWALFCSVSRITDHRHHWWDVLAGSLIGVLFASLTCIILCRNFRRTNKSVNANNHHQNGGTVDYHASVKRLLSDPIGKDEVTLNRVTQNS